MKTDLRSIVVVLSLVAAAVACFTIVVWVDRPQAIQRPAVRSPAGEDVSPAIGRSAPASTREPMWM